MIERKQLVRQLLEASRLLEVLDEDGFRARAYANAARGLEGFEGDFVALVEHGGLTKLKGVGEGLAAEMQAATDDGVLPRLAELRARVPDGVRELFGISGLGTSKVRALWAAGFDSVEALIAGVDRGDVQALKGFGPKSAAAFREGARFVLDARVRMRRDQAHAISREIAGVLEGVFPEVEIEPTGALRRGLESIADLEILVTGVAWSAIEPVALGLLDGFAMESDPSGDAASRTVVACSGTRHGKVVRLVVASPDVRGAALAVSTGSGPYVSWLMSQADARGLRLAENGLYRGTVRLETPTEDSVFHALEVPKPAPELREDPATEPIPDLIELADLRGLVHNHSTWSDAEHSIRQMVAAARAAGFRYLAMADHSKSSFYAGGLTSDRVRQQADEIRAIRADLAAEGSDFALLHGMEVDILPDGSLDYEEDVLASLDYVVVSVHQQFTLTREAQTARIVAAVQNPYADILGHPTGRLLLSRPEYAVDLEAVIEACSETGTVIEINANPRRLDLDWRWVRWARAKGCMFSIDPDAHHVDGFDDLRYGVSVARKGGLTPALVVNTEPTGAAFLGRLKRGPSRA